MTLREYILFWQETYDKHQSRPTTYAAHNYVFKNHILPSLGDIPLSELTSEMVGEFLEERRRFGNHRPGSSGLGEETMRHIHRLLQQCLDQAMRDGLISDNPARAFHYSKPKKVNADVLTPLEMEDYLDAAERLGYLPMFMLALTTGLRQGELIALKWSDLDIESRTLTIAEKRAVVRRELVEYGTNILVDVLCDAINRINATSLTTTDTQKIVNALKAMLENDDLGREFYSVLINGYNGLKLIDFEDFGGTVNYYHVVTEMTCKNGSDEFRPDITPLINGLPLAFIEVKKPNNKGGIKAE